MIAQTRRQGSLLVRSPCLLNPRARGEIHVWMQDMDANLQVFANAFQESGNATSEVYL